MIVPVMLGVRCTEQVQRFIAGTEMQKCRSGGAEQVQKWCRAGQKHLQVQKCRGTVEHTIWRL